MFEIPYPEVEQVHRLKAGTTSRGDWALARLPPGMIAFLDTRINGQSVPIGEGYEPKYTVPFGLAATAAHALLEAGIGGGVHWAGRDVELEWLALPDLSDVLIARAELDAISEERAMFLIEAATETGTHLLRGKLQLSAIHPPPTELVRTVSNPEEPLERSTRKGNLFLRAVWTLTSVPLGATFRVLVDLRNRSLHAAKFRVALSLPFGGGLSLESEPATEVNLPAFTSKTVEYIVRADRPHEVNLARPWPITVRAEKVGQEEEIVVPVRVDDPEKPTIFYVLTEDCETFDGGAQTGNYGTSSVLGNANGFMDPEDYRVQMIEKPNAMNRIAEQFGARWTHFWCAPQRFAVDWAREQSGTGAWDALARDLDDSIARGSEHHEYAPHIHFDYEPGSALPPQPRLCYDEVTDGILPNEYYDPIANPGHKYHDWDGSGRGIDYVKLLGSLTELDSKTGSLRKTVRYLANLQSGRRYPLIARSGGFDFGKKPEDQQISTEAYLSNGLCGNSDAVFPVNQLPVSNGFYWCDESDRLLSVQNLEDAKLVQMAVSLQTDFTDTTSLNAWFTGNLESVRGPGVRVLTAMTHAMFLRGTPDAFRSLTGGSFEGLEAHLRYVTKSHPEVRFATATEALIEYLDYHSPTLRTYVEPTVLNRDEMSAEHSVRLLGRGIRVDENHPATVRCELPPMYDPAEVYGIGLIIDGLELAEVVTSDAHVLPSIKATLTSRPRDFRLKVHFRRGRNPLLRLRSPESGTYSTDLLNLLMNPAAGGTEPLGRRLHPQGAYPIGICLHEALHDRHEFHPCKLKLRWWKIAPEERKLFASTRQEGSVSFVRIKDQGGECIAMGEVTIGANWF